MELLCFLHILLSLKSCRYGKQKSDLKNYQQLGRLKYITDTVDEQDNVFMLIRRYERRTQCEMADCLDMDVKKYRCV